MIPYPQAYEGARGGGVQKVIGNSFIRFLSLEHSFIASKMFVLSEIPKKLLEPYLGFWVLISTVANFVIKMCPQMLLI